ncbi:hypothetical protein JaAD80_24235 [Janthinobacterium sp. AD80]|nr:hypothetical protein JaAD80_24235 [Janthinobacterium sp. AD80]
MKLCKQAQYRNGKVAMTGAALSPLKLGKKKPAAGAG